MCDGIIHKIATATAAAAPGNATIAHDTAATMRSTPGNARTETRTKRLTRRVEARWQRCLRGALVRLMPRGPPGTAGTKQIGGHLCDCPSNQGY